MPQNKERDNSLPGPLINMKNNMDSSPAFQFKGPLANIEMKNNCNISSQGSVKDNNNAAVILEQSDLLSPSGHNAFKEGDPYWSSNNISLRQPDPKPAETISGPSSSVGGLSQAA